MKGDLHGDPDVQGPCHGANVRADPDAGPGGVTEFGGAGDDVLVAMGNALVHLARDGRPLHRIDLGAPARVQIGPRATSALVERGGAFEHVAADGNVLARLGTRSRLDKSGILAARFSAAGTVLLVEVGVSDLEHERTDSVELRDPSGALLERHDGATLAFVGGDRDVVVTARASEAVAVDAHGVELWRAQYRSAIRILSGSRNARTVYLHNDALGFYAGADNSGLLVVDGTPTVVPYLWPMGFSPDERFVASAQLDQVELLADAQAAWKTTFAARLFVESVDVNDAGFVLVAGEPGLDGGITGNVALLYDAGGRLVAECRGLGRFRAAFTSEGTAFGLYGKPGVAVFDLS